MRKPTVTSMAQLRVMELNVANEVEFQRQTCSGNVTDLDFIGADSRCALVLVANLFLFQRTPFRTAA